MKKLEVATYVYITFIVFGILFILASLLCFLGGGVTIGMFLMLSGIIWIVVMTKLHKPV